MMTSQSLQQNKQDQSVTYVLGQVLILNVLVAASKIVVGVMTGTVALIADGLHSTMDGMSNVVGLLAHRVAIQPPDEDHPYGHERFESLGMMAIGGFLLLAAWEVLNVAGERLIEGHTPQVGNIQFAVLITTLMINLGVATYEKRAAIRLQSPLLAADAQHTTSDIWVTLSVIGGLIAVRAGLGWMDAAIALVIVGVIGRAAWKILQSASKVLVDYAPLSSTTLTDTIAHIQGIQKVLRARSRGADSTIEVDLDLQINTRTTSQEITQLANEIRHILQSAFPCISEVRIQFFTIAEKT